jgi:hypothetical protein
MDESPTLDDGSQLPRTADFQVRVRDEHFLPTRPWTLKYVLDVAAESTRPGRIHVTNLGRNTV